MCLGSPKYIGIVINVSSSFCILITLIISLVAVYVLILNYLVFLTNSRQHFDRRTKFVMENQKKWLPQPFFIVPGPI